MPGPAVIRRLYDRSYGEVWEPMPGAGSGTPSPGLLRWLDRLPRGTLLDFGCGDGTLLVAAGERGWTAVGVETDPEVAADVSRRTGARVLTDLSGLAGERGRAVDVVHLGDVIEHLTDPLREVRGILALLRPAGTLLAAGPLEANRNLFAKAILAWRRLAFRRPVVMPPYHVVLATAQGQKRLFARLGLEELEFSISDESWPAPTRLSWADVRRPRSVALFALRHLSTTLNRLEGGGRGNRYFYAGRAPC
jgi:SAM-dependent methyltransferase